MFDCDVLIVGGGPAGSTCAMALVESGLDVRIVDKAPFPRDKVCAGWVTPAVFAELRMDPDKYAGNHTCQPIMGFRVGRIGHDSVTVGYDHAVSYGIRRCEFDNHLLQNCGAQLTLGEPVTDVRKTGDSWVINERYVAPMLVAAGGHFCPVARRLLGTGETVDAPVVAAQEIEFLLDKGQQRACRVGAEMPELYFCDDLAGYGWCVRKGNYLNIGLGREHRGKLGAHLERFCGWLQRAGRIPEDLPGRFHGHAYYLYQHSPRKLVDDGLLAIGDAAGLAYPQSGEGIRPAIESGIFAAAAITAAAGDYRACRLQAYRDQVFSRYGRRRKTDTFTLIPPVLRRYLGAKLLASPMLVRRLVLDRWFLHAREPLLETSFRSIETVRA